MFASIKVSVVRVHSYMAFCRVRWFKGCSLYMYASIKADAIRVCLFKDCSFHMYASIKASVARYAPMLL